MSAPVRKPVKAFCSYSHQDEQHLNKLRTSLRGLERQELIEWWHDRQISAGWEWEEAIDKNLRTADIILFLVSPALMASDYVYEKEIDRAIERHKRGEARVIPIITRPSDWKWTSFGKLQALPRDAKPITTWPNRDEAWLDVVRGIREAIEELLLERQIREAKERYRKAVEEAWTDGTLSDAEAEQFGALASKLGLSTDTAADIEREVMGDTIEAILEHQEEATRQEQRDHRLKDLYTRARRSHAGEAEPREPNGHQESPPAVTTQGPSKVDSKDAEYEAAMNTLKSILAQYIPEFNIPGNIIDDTTKEHAFKLRPARAIIFGHTSVGKTTTINKLLARDIFSATGQLTCTRSLAAAQHKGGLIFYDSPGIGDEPEQENIARVALGLPQLEEDRVSTVRLLDLTEMHQEGPKKFTSLSYVDYSDEIRGGPSNKDIAKEIVGKSFPLAQFQNWRSQHPFDFAVFLTNSEIGLPVPESRLLKDFYQAHPNITMFKVFNVFHNRYKSNIDELDTGVKNKLNQAQDRLKKYGLKDYNQWIVIDSRNGHGMEAFVQSFADCLPVDVLKNLTQVIKQEYSHLIQKKFDQYFFDYLAHVASLVAVFPVDHSEGRTKFLNLTLESLAIIAEFMSPDKNAQAARPLVNDIINQIERRSTRSQSVSVKQYRWPGFLESAQELFGLYGYQKHKVGEYSGVGGINSIKRVLSLGLVIRELFKGHSESELESLLRSSNEEIDPRIDEIASEIKPITRKAGRQFDKDEKVKLSQELYPHIRKLLAEE
jgi:GTP-binding protein EngB required for normal cell division